MKQKIIKTAPWWTGRGALQRFFAQLLPSRIPASGKLYQPSGHPAIGVTQLPVELSIVR
jgi:hypothetical protein